MRNLLAGPERSRAGGERGVLLGIGRVRVLGLALLTLAWMGAPLTESGLAMNVPFQLTGIAIGAVRGGAALPVPTQRSRVLRGTRRVLVQIRVGSQLREFVDVSSSGVTGRCRWWWFCRPAADALAG